MFDAVRPNGDNLELLDDVASAVAKAMAIDWSAPSAAALDARRPMMATLRAQLDALDASWVDAVDRSGIWADAGCASAAALLQRDAPNEPERNARARVARARWLREMPLVAGALQDGDISADHVHALGELLDIRFGDRFSEHEATLAEAAATLSWRSFRALLARWKDATDRFEAARREDADERTRSLRLSRALNDRGVLSALLTPQSRIIVQAELERISQQLFLHDWNEAVARLGEGKVSAQDLRRTPAQRRHDALVIMAERSSGAAAGAQGGTPSLYVHVNHADFVAMAEQAEGLEPEDVPYDQSRCEYEDGTPLSYDQAFRIALRSQIRRVVWGPDGEIIEFGRSRRYFTQTIKEAMAVQHSVCECGCGLSARLCEADHHIEWRDDGPSDLSNARPRCPKSHGLKSGRRKRLGPEQPDPDPPIPPQLE